MTEIAYRRLYEIAQGLLGFCDVTPTLGPTALVNEGYAKMILAGQIQEIRDAGHLYSRFTLCMKHTITDYFRASQTLKQGGNRQRHAWLDALEATVDPMFAELDLLSRPQCQPIVSIVSNRDWGNCSKP